MRQEMKISYADYLRMGGKTSDIDLKTVRGDDWIIGRTVTKIESTEKDFTCQLTYADGSTDKYPIGWITLQVEVELKLVGTDAPVEENYLPQIKEIYDKLKVEHKEAFHSIKYYNDIAYQHATIDDLTGAIMNALARMNALMHPRSKIVK